MKRFKYQLVFALALTVMSLAACTLLPSPTPKPTPKPDNGPKPITRGETVVIFGATSAFTIVYDGEDTDTGAAFADRMSSAVADLGLGKPEISVDTFKTETKCELLIGNTSRALSAEAKAIVEENLTADENGEHWVFLYRDGQLAIYANKASAYERALADLTDKYYKAGEITVKKSTKDVGYVIGPHDAYMEYETPGNFYDGYTDPFEGLFEDYEKMILTRTDAKTYSLDYRDSKGGTWHTTFVQKRWGCWMLGELKYIEKNGREALIQPASTDYEFVLTCAGKDKMTFRGGNHGDYPKVYGGDWVWDAEDSAKSNDRMLDMMLYDAKSGEKIELDIGKGTVVDGLRIVLHNNIYEMEYTQENVLINVEKSYLFNGYDVFCDSKLYMTQDVRFNGNTYTCMLPILKTYGNCMMLYNADGTTTYCKTVLVGDNSYKPNSTGHNATKVELWGENYPQYHTTVEIFNPEDQMMNSHPERGYIRLWDMNDHGNKVYFSAFTNEATLRWGTELNFKSKWSFSYQPDFKNPDTAPEFVIGY